MELQEQCQAKPDDVLLLSVDGEAGEPKLPPAPPSPTAAQADEVAVPENTEETQIALPTSEAPSAPQQTSGPFAGAFPGLPRPPRPMTLCLDSFWSTRVVVNRSSSAAGAKDGVKGALSQASNAAESVLKTAKSQAPGGLATSAGPACHGMAHRALCSLTLS